MKRRNNEDRMVKGHKPAQSEDPPTMANPLDFINPTEFVALPSKGRYPTGHPLQGQDSIEIRYMTAKDEDILTSKSLLKEGIALDRLIQNLIVNNQISSKDLYIGDRNAIIIYARASAYGDKYKTKVTCPNCSEVSSHTFDLNEYHSYDGADYEEFDLEETEHGTFMVTLPMTNIVAEIRPLLGIDEADIIKDLKKDKKGENGLVTNQIKRFCMSFNGFKDKKTINQVVDRLTAVDSRYLRNAFTAISPDLSVKGNFICKSCEYEEEMVVPFGTDFFWPDR
jgi:hypothetical protein